MPLSQRDFSNAVRVFSPRPALASCVRMYVTRSTLGRPQLLPSKKGAALRPGSNELAEMWRAAASLERLDAKVKEQLGQALLRQAKRSPVPTYAFWSLTRLGARVVHRGNALVHVSGHAPAGELLYVLNLVRPANFMPVHGEWRHMRAHAQLAAQTVVPDRGIVIAENGVVVDLVERRAAITGAVPCGYVYVDGLSVGEITETSLKDRRILGEEGFVSIVIVVDSTTGKLTAGPEIQARGSGIDDAAFGAVRPRIDEELAKAAAEGINDPYQLGQLVRRTVGRWVNENYRRRPMIIPVVIQV